METYFYFQGSVHSMSSESCDEGFLAEAYLLCGDDAECREDADGLLDLMVLKGHRWHSTMSAPSSCDAKCSMDYVFGLDTQK